MTDYLTAAEWEAWLTPQDAVEKLLPKLNDQERAVNWLCARVQHGDAKVAFRLASWWGKKSESKPYEILDKGMFWKAHEFVAFWQGF